MKIHVLSSILPKRNYDWIKINSNGPMSHANDSFQRALISGFVENGVNVEVFNVPNIGAYPLNFKKAISPGFPIQEEIVKGYNIGFINFLLLKHSFIGKNLKQEISRYSNEIDYLLIYDLYLPFLNIAKLLKNEKKSLKIILVIPDIYGFTGCSKNFAHRVLTRNEEYKIYNNLKYIDGFVLLTEQMLEKLPKEISRNQYQCVEGILNPDVVIAGSTKKDLKRIVLYSGAIEERHGIRNLIEAFKLLIVDAELHLYGDGSDKDQLMELAHGFSNIIFYGQNERSFIIRKQREATLLINPRTSEGEFTKYSFPSKVIEYFASGTPTLMYKLDGIPDEYYNFCYTPDDNSIEGLKHELDKCLGLRPEKLDDKGAKAKAFVMENKSSLIQARKILNLFENL